VSGRVIALSNFLAGAFVRVDRAFGRMRRGAVGAARRALPQRCELRAAPSGNDLI
jgi:hypothetical protein